MKPNLSKLLRFAPIVATLLSSAPAFATEIIDDPLHAFCYGSSSCADNGTVTPTANNPPQFGFSISPGPQTGHFLLDLLVPTNLAATPSALSFSITGTQGGAANNTALSATSSLFSGTAWTSGDLISYLGLVRASGAPPNPIGAWLPSTNLYDPGATGYYVYTFDLGIDRLQPNTDELSGPLLDFTSGLLPAGALVVGFLENSDHNVISTSQSGALIIDPPAPVPEPGSLSLIGAALLGLGAARRRSKRARGAVEIAAKR